MKWFLNSYEDESLEIQKKAKILLSVSLGIAAAGLLLGLAMLATGAFAVSLVLIALFVFCGFTAYLIRIRRFRLASYFFLVFLFLVCFAAIKFDEYISIRETYVFGMLGLFVLVSACLVGYQKFQPILVTLLNIIGITLLYAIDILPNDGGVVSELHIQSLVTPYLLTILAGIMGASSLNLQQTVIKIAENQTQSSIEQYQKFNTLVNQTQAKGLLIAQSLSSSSESTISMISQIYGKLSEMKGSLERLDLSISKSSTANKSVLSATGTVHDNLEDYSRSVDLVGRTISDIARSISGISEGSEAKEESIKSLIQTTRTGEQKMKISGESIEKISKSSATILNVVNLIADIAERTNLLALNAAIEASHAGEAGKGFAVVASEIRKLAEETGKNSDIIAQNLNKNLEDIENSSEISREVNDVFKTILDGVGSVTGILEEVVSGINEMSESSREILNAVEKIEGSSHDVDEAVSNVLELTGESAEEISEVRRLSRTLLSGIEEILEVFDRMTNEAQNVDQIGKENMDHIQKLSGI